MSRMHSKLRSWRSKHQPFNQLHPSLNVKLAAAGDRLSTPAPVMLLISRLHPVTDFRTILPWRRDRPARHRKRLVGWQVHADGSIPAALAAPPTRDANDCLQATSGFALRAIKTRKTYTTSGDITRAKSSRWQPRTYSSLALVSLPNYPRLEEASSSFRLPAPVRHLQSSPAMVLFRPLAFHGSWA